MKWPAQAAAIVLYASVAGCDKIPFIGNRGADTTATDTAAAVAAAPVESVVAQVESVVAQPAQPTPTQTQPTQTAPARQTPRRTPPQQASQTPPTQAPARRTAAGPAPRMDEPWTPRFTGTVDPGMTADQVIAQWGPPVARRSAGQWTYLYFRNGCEVSCGMLDVVLLQDGQVVDAVVRATGHTYSGVSSSPRGRPAMYTAPGTTMEREGAES